MNILKTKQVGRGASLLSLASLAAFAAFEAGAQETVPLNFINPWSIDGVVAVTVQVDGRLEVSFSDGSSILISPENFLINGDQVLIDSAILDGSELIAVTSSEGLGGAVVFGGAAVLAGTAAIMGLSGGSDDAPVNAAPVFSSSITANIDEGSSGAAYTASATDPEGVAITYSLSGGADEALFTINSSTGEVSFTNVPDFESPADADGDNAYEIIVTASDGSNSVTQAVTITVSDINDNVPVITSVAAVSVAEGDVSVVTVTSTDADVGDVVTYTLGTSGDSALFAIDVNTGALTFIGAPDFEAPTDGNADNIYEVEIIASDGVNTTTQTVTVTVTDVNDIAPVFTSGTSANVNENSSATGYTATATDAEGNTVTYSLGASGDSAAFTIDPNTGVLSFTASPDFETPTDGNTDNIYDVEIIASDGVNTTTQTVSVAVDNLDDEAPVFAAATATGVGDENQTSTNYIASATNTDGASAVTYSLGTSGDSGVFSINPSTGALSFSPAQDYEAVTDANADNIYEVEVIAVDGSGLTSTQNVSISLGNTNDNAPIITSVSAISVGENLTSTGYTAIATDADGNVVTYSLGTSGDSAAFTIDPNTGVLSFTASPDFEAPTDGNSDNIYDVEIVASDGANGTTQMVAVTVTNVNDIAPVFTSGTSTNVNENSSATGYTATATDAEGNTVTYSLGASGDSAAFTIDPNTGVLSFTASPDFETPTDGNTDNIYDVEIIASDGVNTTTQTVSVGVADIDDEAPVFAAATATGAGDENQTSTNYVASATNTDGTSAVTYSLGTSGDSGFFAINAATGVLSFISSPDFEGPLDADTDNIYEVEVIAVDGSGLTSTQTVSVSVNDIVAELSPVFSTPNTANVDENSTAAILTVQAPDPQGDTVTYSITGGADAALFGINGTTGALSFIAGQDFETPADANTDGSYEVIITADDGNGNTEDQTITVTVDNLDDEAPVFAAATATGAGDENQTSTSYVASATNTDGASAVTYSLGTSGDSGFFAINAATGVLSFVSSPDFESPLDADTDNVYEVEVIAVDGSGQTTTQTVSVSVGNLNDNAPVFTSGTSTNVNENSSATGYTATATDAEGNTVTYSLGASGDSAAFTIDPNTGVLSFTASPDFETPTDGNTDNIYDVEIIASDGVNTTTQTVSVGVADIDDEAPVFAAATATGAGDENQTSTNYVASATNTDGTSAVTYSLGTSGDSGFFAINAATGVLSFISSPDFEGPLDADTDNIYEVEVIAVDGSGLTSTQTVSVSVGNLNDNTPVFTSGTSSSVNENVFTAGYTANATDADGDTLTYSLGTSGDSALFTFFPSLGVLNFTAAPDFEAPTDGNADNVYEVELIASDGVNTTTQMVSVTVNNTNDNAPVFTSGTSASVNENSSATGYTAVATDGDGDTVTYSLGVSGDNAAFTIDPFTGVLSFTSSPDFEAPTDGNTDNVYDVVITANDGFITTTQTVSVVVGNLDDEAPVFASATATASGDENQSSTNYIASATNTDGPSSAVTYSLGTNFDDFFFTINATTGVLSFSFSPDFEDPLDQNVDNVFEVEVIATDGSGLTSSQTVSVAVNDIALASRDIGDNDDNGKLTLSLLPQLVQPDDLSHLYEDGMDDLVSIIGDALTPLFEDEIELNLLGVLDGVQIDKFSVQDVLDDALLPLVALSEPDLRSENNVIDHYEFSKGGDLLVDTRAEVFEPLDSKFIDDDFVSIPIFDFV